MGGHAGDGVVNPSMDVIHPYEQVCPKEPIPRVPNWSTYGSPMVYTMSKLFLNGGYDQGLNLTANTSWILDLDDEKREWTLTADLNTARAFHNLVVRNNGEVYAIGGQTSDLTCVTTTEMFNGTAWQVVPSLTLPTPRTKSCSIYHEEVLYVIGGHE